jgi:hypothetical protein
VSASTGNRRLVGLQDQRDVGLPVGQPDVAGRRSRGRATTERPRSLVIHTTATAPHSSTVAILPQGEPPDGQRRMRGPAAATTSRARHRRRRSRAGACGGAAGRRRRTRARTRPAGTRRRPSRAIAGVVHADVAARLRTRRAGIRRSRPSSDVTPPVEWMRTSAACTSSGIRRVNPQTLTRSSAAKRRASACRLRSRSPARTTTCPAPGGQRARDRALEITDAPAAARDHDERAVGVQAERRGAPTPDPARAGTPRPPAAGRASRCRPAIRSTSPSVASCITRCTSTPRWHHTARSRRGPSPSRTAGRGRRRCRRIRPRTAVRAGCGRHHDVGRVLVHEPAEPPAGERAQHPLARSRQPRDVGP